MGPAVGGILADTVGIRAPFTFTGIAAALAALYGLIRLPETGKSRRAETEREAESSVLMQNNAVPAVIAGSPVKLQLAEQAVVGSRTAQQQGAAEEIRRRSSALVSFYRTKRPSSKASTPGHTAPGT